MLQNTSEHHPQQYVAGHIPSEQNYLARLLIAQRMRRMSMACHMSSPRTALHIFTISPTCSRHASNLALLKAPLLGLSLCALHVFSACQTSL
jgi:hypothetical protein